MYARLPSDPGNLLMQTHESEASEPELEFKAIHICMETGMECGTAAAKIENLLNEGWQIDEKITCRPFVIITFSREKEITEDARE